MDIFASIIEKVYSSLSAAEFTLLIILAIIMLPMLLKTIIKLLGNKNVIGSFGGNEEELTKINTAMNTLATKDDIAAVKNNIQEIQKKIAEGHEDIADLKRDFSGLSATLNREVIDLAKRIETLNIELSHTNDNVKELLNKISGSIGKLLSQVDKIDDFAKTSVPEFRNYHIEISKDLSELSRDIALVERSLQNQINNTNAVKLR